MDAAQRAAQLRRRIDAAAELAAHGATDAERETARRTVAHLRELHEEVAAPEAQYDLRLHHDNEELLVFQLAELYGVELLADRANHRRLRLQGSPRAVAILIEEYNALRIEYRRFVALAAIGWLHGRLPLPPKDEPRGGGRLSRSEEEALAAGLRAGARGRPGEQAQMKLAPRPAGLLEGGGGG